MYTENEKKTLSKATVRLLRKSAHDIRLDKTNTASTLLKLRAFATIAYNDSARCKELATLIMAGMWNMFDKEIRR